MMTGVCTHPNDKNNRDNPDKGDNGMFKPLLTIFGAEPNFP